MFNNTTHVIKNPVGSFSLVGAGPTLATRTAAVADIMAGRSYTADDGTELAPQGIAFATADEAATAVRSAGTTATLGER